VRGRPVAKAADRAEGGGRDGSHRAQPFCMWKTRVRIRAAPQVPLAT
jgi:hypothetical protein